MKKFFISLLASILAIGLQAQEGFGSSDAKDSSYRIYLGPKVGTNLATMSGMDALNPAMGIGFQGGLAANIHFGRRTEKADGGTGRFGLQVEALYSQRTIQTDYENLKLSYFEVPILAQFYALPVLSIEVGPTIVGSLSSSPDEMQVGNLTYATGDLKGFDVMISAGVGYTHKSGFTASARYNLGMSELAGNFHGKVSTFSISIGWLFNLNKEKEK